MDRRFVSQLEYLAHMRETTSPLIPGADPRAGHPRCGGRKSNFLQTNLNGLPEDESRL